MKEFLVVILVLVMLMNITLLVARRKISKLLKKYLGTSNLKEAIELSEIANENTPKSLSGMEAVALPMIERDFPNLNINELKRQAEASIISYLNMMETKKYTDIKYASDKIKTYIESHIADLQDDVVVYDEIKIHRTIVNKYEKKNGMATITFQTAIEYKYKKNNSTLKKVQDRFQTEFIYIIDTDKLSDKVKAIGLNCPNCGAPIKNVGNINCEYCSTSIIDIVKRTWYFNNISNI